METIKREFGEEFYAKLYSKIEERTKTLLCEDGNDTYDLTFTLDGYYIELCALYKIRWQDDSFDHAFGTQRYEPYPVIEGLSMVSDVLVLNEEGYEVEGFDIERFMKVVRGEMN